MGKNLNLTKHYLCDDFGDGQSVKYSLVTHCVLSKLTKRNISCLYKTGWEFKHNQKYIALQLYGCIQPHSFIQPLCSKMDLSGWAMPHWANTPGNDISLGDFG